MTAARRPRVGTGCVLRAADGLLEVLTERGPVVASLGGTALTRLAADPATAARPGDRVELTWWSDGPVTVERVHRGDGPTAGSARLRPV